MAKLDIFLITYNRAFYLKKAMQSILNQSYNDYNLTILDNCSTDNTRDVVASFDDDRITYICHETNIGSSGNWNYGFKRAVSDYIMIFHDDDMMDEDMIAKELSILDNNPSIDALSCKCRYIDSNDNIIHSNYVTRELQIFSGKDFFDAYISKNQYILFPAIIYKREFVHKYGLGTCKEAGPSADVLLIFEIERCGGTVAIYDEELMSYRRHENQDSSQNRVYMHVQLFRYLWSNDYYSKLMKENLKGMKRHFNVLMRYEICGVQNGMTDAIVATKAFEDYKTVYDFDIFDRIKYSLILFDERHFNFSKLFYKIVKRLN